MFHHLVFFYLKKDLTAAQRAEFEAKLRGLLAIKSIHSGYVGVPSKHAVRPIIDILLRLRRVLRLQEPRRSRRLSGRPDPPGLHQGLQAVLGLGQDLRLRISQG